MKSTENSPEMDEGQLQNILNWKNYFKRQQEIEKLSAIQQFYSKLLRLKRNPLNNCTVLRTIIIIAQQLYRTQPYPGRSKSKWKFVGEVRFVFRGEHFQIQCHRSNRSRNHSPKPLSLLLGWWWWCCDAALCTYPPTSQEEPWYICGESYLCTGIYRFEGAPDPLKHAATISLSRIWVFLFYFVVSPLGLCNFYNSNNVNDSELL